MGKFVITMAALLAVAMATSSRAAGSGHWITQPRCTATTTALTCTGRASGVQPRFIVGLGAVEAGITGEVHYMCGDPVFQAIFYGFPPDAVDVGYFAESGFHNGRRFLVEFSPPSEPLDRGARIRCLSGEWTRDPGYYNVRVAVGWGFGSYSPIGALDAFVGTVSPG
jgi:hypothetical protein